MTLRRRKSRKAKAADMVGSYLKLKAAGKVVKNIPTLVRVPIIAGAGAAAAFFAAKAVRGGGEGHPA
ncbi:MAG: hypothetical protein ACRDPC_22040 [Solirubrobacteraceae bacterium]